MWNNLPHVLRIQEKFKLWVLVIYSNEIHAFKHVCIWVDVFKTDIVLWTHRIYKLQTFKTTAYEISFDGFLICIKWGIWGCSLFTDI